MILRDYRCSACNRTVELLEDRNAPSEQPCDCGGTMARLMSAPAIHMPNATVTRGKPEPPPPNALDTRPLADGMPLKEWRKRRHEQRRREMHDKIKAML